MPETRLFHGDREAIEAEIGLTLEAGHTVTIEICKRENLIDIHEPVATLDVLAELGGLESGIGPNDRVVAWLTYRGDVEPTVLPDDGRTLVAAAIAEMRERMRQRRADSLAAELVELASGTLAAGQTIGYVIADDGSIEETAIEATADMLAKIDVEWPPYTYPAHRGVLIFSGASVRAFRLDD